MNSIVRNHCQCATVIALTLNGSDAHINLDISPMFYAAMLRHQVQIMLTEGYSCIFSRVHHFRVCFRGRESRIGRHGEHLRLD